MKIIPHILILFGGAMRIVPHAPNFTPIGAIALFGATYLPKKWALILPILVMVVSDYFIGFHGTMPYVYGSFLVIGLMGLWLRKHKTTKNVVLASLGGSVLFFLVTNFGVWLGRWYPQSWQGLISCYTNALPFFRNTLLGDLVYTGAFFGLFELAKYMKSLSLSKAENLSQRYNS